MRKIKPKSFERSVAKKMKTALITKKENSLDANYKM